MGLSIVGSGGGIERYLTALMLFHIGVDIKSPTLDRKIATILEGRDPGNFIRTAQRLRRDSGRTSFPEILWQP
jgi:hypothetical protein